MRHINVKRVAYFYEAVTQGTVRAAADKLNIAPSAVSRQIALLEQELATTLLERHRKGVFPTQAGDILLRFYRDTQSHQDNCLAALDALHGLQQGHINLAVGEGFISDLMSQPLPEFHQEHPQLTLSITMGGTNDVLRWIEEDSAEIGILFHPPTHPQVRTQCVSRQPLCAILSPGHPLATQAKPLSFDQLMQYPLALQEAHFGIRQLLAMVEFTDRIRLSPAVTTNSIAVLKHFVRSQIGITFLPAFSITREIADGHLVARPIDHPILQSGEVHMITRLGRELSTGPNTLLQYLRQWMQAFQEK